MNMSIPVRAIQILSDYGMPLGVTMATWKEAKREVDRFLDGLAQPDTPNMAAVWDGHVEAEDPDEEYMWTERAGDF